MTVFVLQQVCIPRDVVWIWIDRKRIISKALCWDIPSFHAISRQFIRICRSTAAIMAYTYSLHDADQGIAIWVLLHQYQRWHQELHENMIQYSPCVYSLTIRWQRGTAMHWVLTVPNNTLDHSERQQYREACYPIWSWRVSRNWTG